MDLLVALSALRVAGEEGGGWTRSFARDVRRRGTGRAGKGGMALVRSVGRTEEEGRGGGGCEEC